MRIRTVTGLIAGLALVVASCGDDEKSVSAAERDASIYATVLRDMVLAEIPPADPTDDSDALPILYVTGADGESMPITALAMPIRVFCAPPADYAAEITDPPGGPRCRCGLELAAPAWRSVSGTQVNRASWPLRWRPARVGFA